MHGLLRHARRVMIGAAMGALFLTGVANASSSLDTLCISPSHQNVILPIGGSCDKPNRLITWDPAGVRGLTGPSGPQGMQGPTGPVGLIGPSGPQGPVGPAGMIGRTGYPGATGPEGPAGEMGSQGPEGPTGPTGATGPTGYQGSHGVNGVNGVQFYTLGGGDMGSNVVAANNFLTQLAGEVYCIQTGTGSNTLWYGPGNGADTILESEAVPIDHSTVTQLWVQTKNVPGPGASYTFTLYKNTTPTYVTCSVGNPSNSFPSLTECNDLSDTAYFNAGDTIALQGTASSGAAATEVSWMVVLHQTGGDVTFPGK